MDNLQGHKEEDMALNSSQLLICETMHVFVENLYTKTILLRH